jgi:hypothetical protein
MASVETDICNLALFRIRADEIGSLDEQSAEAEKCRVLYPQARDTVLSTSGIAWPFAKKTVALALDSETPEQWSYGYSYPVDCVKALYIIPNVDPQTLRDSQKENREHLFDDSPIEYELLNSSGSTPIIATNQEDAKLAYISRVEDVRLFNSLFVEALVWKLAMDLAIPIAGDSGVKYRNDASIGYQQALAEAKTSYKNQSYPRMKQRAPNSIRARMR